MGLTAKEVVLSPSAEDALRRLEAAEAGSPGRTVAKRVRQLGTLLRSDCLHGEVVKKRLLPRALVEKYRVGNMYVEDLPGFWRLLYSIAHAGPDRFVIVLEIVDHPAYDRWFPGRGRH